MGLYVGLYALYTVSSTPVYGTCLLPRATRSLSGLSYPHSTGSSGLLNNYPVGLDTSQQHWASFPQQQQQIRYLATHYGCVEEDCVEKTDWKDRVRIWPELLVPSSFPQSSISTYYMHICCLSNPLSEYCESLFCSYLLKEMWVVFFLCLRCFYKSQHSRKNWWHGSGRKRGRHF